jgi:hypothetical protein
LVLLLIGVAAISFAQDAEDQAPFTEAEIDRLINDWLTTSPGPKSVAKSSKT